MFGVVMPPFPHCLKEHRGPHQVCGGGSCSVDCEGDY